jgi:uncharacterized membrane protein YjgN (DUF898 family)
MWMRAIRQFQLAGLSYGTSRFKCDPEVKGYFGAYLKPLLLVMGIGIIFIILFVLLATLDVRVINFSSRSLIGSVIILSTAAMYLVTITLIKAYVQVRLANLTWNATSLNQRAFHSSQQYLPYLRIIVGNFFMTLITFGLYWPWAKVRETSYRLEHLALDNFDLDAFVGQVHNEVSAVGEEIADAFDLDFSL